MKGVGRIYQQTFIDTYSKVVQAKLYTTKTPITAADLLNDRVLPLFEHHELPMLRMLTDRGTEYCGRADQHDYELYLALNDIDHTRTKARSPQTNGICERFHKTVLQEFYGTDQIRLNRFTPAREDLPCYVERGIGVSRDRGRCCAPRGLSSASAKAGSPAP